jgi:hypothetical protein
MRGLIWRLAAATAALALAPAAHAGGPAMLIGATEDAVRAPTLVGAKAQFDLAKLAGFDGVRITQIWAPGETEISDDDLASLQNVTAAAALDNMTVLTSVLPFGSKTTPVTQKDQADFAAYAASVVHADRAVRYLIVGNEPNLNRYWLPQFNDDGSDAAAPAYESLLAKTYDAVKAVSKNVQVIGGAVSPRGADDPTSSRQTHSPTVFIQDMGAAYRASGRTAPIMDAFAFHPYEDNSSVAPILGTHPSTTTIAIADYGKLVTLLGKAFDGTAQPGSTLPIYYDEFGVETVVPPAKAARYTGAEPLTTKAVDPATQGTYYQQAIQLAFCQPNVRGLFLFHVFDEKGLPQWQSGLYYADETPKSSLPAVRLAMQQSRRGVVAHCDGLKLTPKAKVVQRATRLMLSCNLDCSFVAQLYRLPDTLLFTAKGVAVGGVAARLPLDVPSTPGSYQLRLSLLAAVNPGAAVVLRMPVRVSVHGGTPKGESVHESVHGGKLKPHG